jgi:2-methylcitrate dehydratase PrpD
MRGVGMSATAGATARLAGFLAGLSYEDLPPAVTTALKHQMLDTLGTTLAASTLGEGCRELVAVVQGAGGAPESTLLGFGTKVPAAQAALANGGLAHALNYDAGGAGHLGLMMPTPLALAERSGGVSGRELLAALAVGIELTARLNLAMLARRPSGAPMLVLDGQLFGYFGAAAAAARVLRLDARRMHSALGLALMQAAGTMQVVLDGDPPAKAIYAAFANHGGLLAAQLAAAGLGAECAALEGAAGLYGLYYGGRYDPATLERALGEEWCLLRIAFKPWPTSGVLHPFIEAALDIAAQHDLAVDDVAQVELSGSPEVLHWFEPVEPRKRPGNGATAANSIFYAVAKALANRRVTLADFAPEGLHQPEVLALTERMHHTVEDGLGRSAVVEVVTRGGERHRRHVDTALGHPSRPMTREQLVAKFRDCAQYAATAVPPATLTEVEQLVDALEDVPDVSAIPALLGERGEMR